MASLTDPMESSLTIAGEADGGLTPFCFCDRLVITDGGVFAIFNLDYLRVVGAGVHERGSEDVSSAGSWSDPKLTVVG